MICLFGTLLFVIFMETLTRTTLNSPIGPLFLAASPGGLVALEFDARFPGQQSIRPNPRHLCEEKKAIAWRESDGEMLPYLRELEQNFARQRREFSFLLHLRRPNFPL